MNRLRLAVGTIAVAASAITVAPQAAAAPLTTPPPLAAPVPVSAAATNSTASLAAVSCTSRSACTAVGSTELGTLAERWNGRRWAIQPVPSPGKSGSGTELSAVSCAAPAMCMAVGSLGNPSPTATLAELWNGRSWRVRRPVTPAHRHATLLGVSCPDRTMCMAVGDLASGPALAERWNGSSWAVLPLPRVPKAQITLLESVSCTSPAACTATGSYAGNDADGTVAERWNGVRWTVQAKPQAAADLPGVSCAAATACTAVGQSAHTTGYAKNFAIGWNGHSWVAQHPPDPAHNAGTELSAVSCPSPAACFAVGDYYRTGKTSNYATLAERWNGTSWAQLTAPSTRGANFLTGVSCSSAAACMAVGTGRGGLLAERWDGARWAIVPVPAPRPVPVPGSGSLTGVSCTSAASCTAVGGELTTAATTFAPLAERWDGHRWLAQRVPNPVYREDGSELSAVSCTSGQVCTAVGQRGSGVTASLAERWQGGRWTVQPIPNMSRNDTGLQGVTCTSAGWCTAAGFRITPRGLLLTLAEHWNGTRWARQHTPSPPVGPGVGGGTLDAIGCSSAAACTAVGAADIVPPVIERWNGTSWAMRHSPRVGHPGPGELAAVSCPAAAVCLAAGNTGGSDTNFHALALAERWTGQAWAIQRIPEPVGTVDSYLNGISCSSPVACTAVGVRINHAERDLTLAERWNGRTWSIQDTPSRPGDSVFNAVSCPSATACVAVGQGRSGPLAARWNGKTWTLLRTPGPGASGDPGQVVTPYRLCRMPDRCGTVSAPRLTARIRVPDLARKKVSGSAGTRYWLAAEPVGSKPSR